MIDFVIDFYINIMDLMHDELSTRIYIIVCLCCMALVSQKQDCGL